MAGSLPCRQLGDNCSHNVSVLTTRSLSLTSKAYISNTFCFGKTAAAWLSSWVGAWDAGCVQLGDESSCYPTENEHSPSRAPGAAPASGHPQPGSGVYGKTETTRGHFLSRVSP